MNPYLQKVLHAYGSRIEYLEKMVEELQERLKELENKPS